MIHDSYFKIVGLYVSYFKEHGEEKVVELCLKSTCASNVLCTVYKALVADEAIPQIELITEESKRKCWKYAIYYSQDKKVALQKAKAYYTLIFLTQYDW